MKGTTDTLWVHVLVSEILRKTADDEECEINTNVCIVLLSVRIVLFVS